MYVSMTAALMFVLPIVSIFIVQSAGVPLNTALADGRRRCLVLRPGRHSHLLHTGRNKLQNVAMASDIFIAVVLAVFCIATALAVEP